MANLHLFKTAPIRNDESGRLALLIAQLTRSVELLSADISSEEDRLKIYDEREPIYPMLARTLKVRRDNLLATIEALETLLVAQPEAVL